MRRQRTNANRHTERGMAMLKQSVEQDGWIGAITVAANDETFDGSARLEVNQAEPIIIDSDGSRPIVVRRTDIGTADDPKAHRLGIAANRVAQANLEWDPAVLAELAGTVNLSDFWNDDELSALLAEPNADDWTEALGGLPSGDRAPFQQMTFTLSDEQAEQVKAAMRQAQQAGPFVLTGNENSNGNALARICEGYLGIS